MAVVGADFDNSIGAAYVFRISTGEQIGTLVADDLTLFGLFGTSVSTSDGKVIFGAPMKDGAGASSGAAFLFDVVPEPTTPTLIALAR